jgi:lipopolysaccharide export system permease protein
MADRWDGRGRTIVQGFDIPLLVVAVLLAVVLAWRLIAMLTILDRQRYWAFLKAYVICYVSLVGLYVVIDAFSNLDEFSKRADTTAEMFQIMSRFYLIHQSEFFDRLCGVIGMMAAIFTVTWMQRNNEHLAMLAAGISTNRAIVPVLVSSVIVSLIAVGNQELVIPYFGEELARRHDDDGMVQVNLVATRYDARGIMMHGKSADRASRTIVRYNATLPRPILGKIHEIIGTQASYFPPDHPSAPLKGGWLIREATINPPLDEAELEESGTILTRVDDLEGYPPPLNVSDKSDKPGAPDGSDSPEEPSTSPMTPHSEIAYLASVPPLPLAGDLGLWQAHMLLDRKLDFVRGTFFLRSALTFEAMTRKTNWYQFATTVDLFQSLTDPSLEGSQAMEVAIFLHGRLLRPVLSMSLLFMSLPLVLGGYGRNMFINLGFALGNSAIFYGALIFAQYLGSFEIISAALTAWAPLIGFGMIATVRWGQIRT